MHLQETSYYFSTRVMDVHNAILMITVACNMTMNYPQIIKLLCTHSTKGINVKMFWLSMISGILQLINFCFNKPLLLQWISCANGIVCNIIIIILCLIYREDACKSSNNNTPLNDNCDSLISVGSVLLYTQPGTAMEVSSKTRMYISTVSGYLSLLIVLIGRFYQLRNRVQNLSIIFLILAIISNSSYIAALTLKYFIERDIKWLYNMLYLLIGNSVELLIHICLLILTIRCA